jgi:outer membrane protein assembly factor BamB
MRPLLLSLAIAPSLLADWPQWRGPNRDGVSTDTTPVTESIPETGLVKVWESDPIPSDHYGGHGSPIVAGERVYLSVVWHERIPSEQREIDTEVMQQLNHRGTKPDLAKKLEDARLALSPRLRGDKLDAFIEQWLQENMTEKDRIALGSWAASRFKAGRTAFPLAELDKVSARQGKPFPSAEAFRQWMAEQQLSPALQEKLLAAVPNTIKTAKDAIVCLDLATGKQIWRFESAGLPVGRNASSTAAVIDDRVYAVASTHLYCVDAETGKEIWKAPLTRKGPAASPLVVNGKVFIGAGSALAFDAATGALLWEQKQAKGDTGSPQWWQPETGAPVLLFTTNNALLGLDPSTGEIQWSVAGGGQSTPVTAGDWLVFYSGADGVGLRAAKYQKDGPPKTAWSHFWITRRYSGSPIIHEGHVYLYCGEKHQCVTLETGEVKWKETANSTITSPLLADGKIIVLENNGSHVSLTSTDPAAYKQFARVRIDAMGCTSPAIANGRLIVRQKDKLTCFDLRPTP